jgi:hypothetical protein
MVFMRDNCFAIEPLHEPVHRNAGLIRQNCPTGITLPGESGAPRAPWFMVSEQLKQRQTTCRHGTCNRGRRDGQQKKANT